MGELSFMDDTGDTKLSWDPANADEVANARRTFDSLRAKAFIAYRATNGDGSKGEIIRTFDPSIAKIILVPPFSGG